MKHKFTIAFIFVFICINNICVGQNPINVVLTKILKENAEPVNCLAYSHDGKLLASGTEGESIFSDSGKFEIIIWSVSNYKNLGHLLGNKDAIKSICFNKNGTELVSVDENWFLHAGIFLYGFQIKIFGYPF